MCSAGRLVDLSVRAFCNNVMAIGREKTSVGERLKSPDGSTSTQAKDGHLVNAGRSEVALKKGACLIC